MTAVARWETIGLCTTLNPPEWTILMSRLRNYQIGAREISKMQLSNYSMEWSLLCNNSGLVRALLQMTQTT